jgi:RNA polymerase sigma factor (sigma-70 family)
MRQSLKEEIWLHISQGNKVAYSELYVFYYKIFFNYGRKFTDDISLLEDALQECLMDIWSRREKLVSIQTPHTYLFSAFRYTLFRKIRQSARLKVYNLSGPADPQFGIEHIIIKKEEESELNLKLQQAIRELTSRQREAIFLRFYEGLSYEEVAEVLGISVKATYKIMARALLQLKETLSIPLLSILLLLRDTGFLFR